MPVEALDALVRLVVELDVVGLALRVHHLEGVRPVAVEVAVAHGGAPVGEQEADLFSMLQFTMDPSAPGINFILNFSAKFGLNCMTLYSMQNCM